MWKRFFVPLVTVCVVVVMLTSCRGKLTPIISDYIKVEPLELIENEIPVTIHATFPQKWFNKKASVTVTPVLRYKDGEVLGTPYTYRGEGVKGNSPMIPFRDGANVELKSTFNYTPEMRNAQLYLTFQAAINNKPIAIPDIKIAEGIMTTCSLLDPTVETLAMLPDKHQQGIKDVQDANILFPIEQTSLLPSELNKKEVADWTNLVVSASTTPNRKVNIEISSYASPEGGFNLNEKLAEERKANTEQYLSDKLKKANANVSVHTNYTAQDWEGFKELVEKSDIPDKKLILRVLAIYSDSEQREREIRNLSEVFPVLTEKILPQLRRSKLTANIGTIEKSDEEILALTQSNPNALNVEELLYAAHLTPMPQDKENLYKKVTKQFPDDARGFNNLGVISFAKGDISSAESLFNKASQLTDKDLPEINFNLGWIAIAKGDKAKAKQYFGNVADVVGLNHAMGYLALLDGNYMQAVQTFGKETYNNNVAIAQILTRDYSAAQNTLDTINNPNAVTYYLKAIVAARTDKLHDAVENLEKAIGINSELRLYASEDTEFAKFVADEEFLKVVGNGK